MVLLGLFGKVMTNFRLQIFDELLKPWLKFRCHILPLGLVVIRIFFDVVSVVGPSPISARDFSLCALSVIGPPLLAPIRKVLSMGQRPAERRVPLRRHLKLLGSKVSLRLVRILSWPEVEISTQSGV
jgi:hypothetical protein